MSTSAMIVVVILLGAFGLFVTGALAPDLIAVAVLVSLVFTESIDPATAFAGFSSFAVIAIGALMVVGDGLERTGVVRWVARRLERVIGKSSRRMLVLNTGIPGVLSGFVNIVAAASFFVPVILRLCKRTGYPRTKVLLPMACAALMGANLTLIGASHNLVVNSLLQGATGEGFSFFEFTPVGAILLALGLVYSYTLGQKLLPEGERIPPPEEVPEGPDLVEVYELEDRLSEVWVSEELGDDAPTLEELDFPREGLRVVATVREGELLVVPEEDLRLREGDLLLVQGRDAAVEEFVGRNTGLVFLGEPEAQRRYPISTGELAEAVIPPRSPAIGHPIHGIDQIRDFGMTVLAYFRDGRPRRTLGADALAEEGDALLVYGPREKMREFEPEKDLLIYFKPGEPEIESQKRGSAPVAAAILALVILGAALDLFPIAATAVAGALAMVLLGIVPLEKVYDAIDWKTLILVAGMYPLGAAMQQSGAAAVMGDALIGTVGHLGPRSVLAALVLLTMVLTQPMHNAAVAILVTPIALKAAAQMGVAPEAFCVGVVVACSTAFLMPYGHPAPLMVQEPGEYQAGDYLRFGLGLNVLAFAVVLVVVPWMWPL